MTDKPKIKYVFHNKQFELLRESRKDQKSPSETTQKDQDSKIGLPSTKQMGICHLQPVTIRSTHSSFSTPSRQMIHRSVSYFSGDVLDGEDDYKMYLTETIEHQLSMNIKRTRLLFRFDPLATKVNIHQYIDNTPNFILIVKTEQGYHFASFSEAALTPKNIPQGRGFIISLTNRKCFSVMAGKKTVRYDSHFLIFGNNEISIQGKDRKVFSNFGVNNASFDARQEGVGTILGEGKQKEVKIVNFQVHEILFK